MPVSYGSTWLHDDYMIMVLVNCFVGLHPNMGRECSLILAQNRAEQSGSTQDLHMSMTSKVKWGYEVQV